LSKEKIKNWRSRITEDTSRWGRRKYKIKISNRLSVSKIMVQKNMFINSNLNLGIVDLVLISSNNNNRHHHHHHNDNNHKDCDDNGDNDNNDDDDDNDNIDNNGNNGINDNDNKA